ncbi:MAG: hypothetical protein ABEN55_20345 [Bradymonadaceae bacterium]
MSERKTTVVEWRDSEDELPENNARVLFVHDGKLHTGYYFGDLNGPMSLFSADGERSPSTSDPERWAPIGELEDPPDDEGGGSGGRTTTVVQWRDPDVELPDDPGQRCAVLDEAGLVLTGIWLADREVFSLQTGEAPASKMTGWAPLRELREPDIQSMIIDPGDNEPTKIGELADHYREVLESDDSGRARERLEESRRLLNANAMAIYCALKDHDD